MTPQEEITNFQTSHPSQNKAFYFTKAQILTILASGSTVDGIRVYTGQDVNNKYQGYANPCDGATDFISPGQTLQRTKMLPCPTYCT
jgi:hypothetical protein